MEPTIIGGVVAVIGLVMLTRSLTAMVMFVLVCSLFGGASVLNLTSLGNSSVPPTDFALLFLALRLVPSRACTFNNAATAVRQNVFLVAFCLLMLVGPIHAAAPCWSSRRRPRGC